MQREQQILDRALEVYHNTKSLQEVYTTCIPLMKDYQNPISFIPIEQHSLAILDRFLIEVASVFGTSVPKLLSKSKKREVVDARFAFLVIGYDVLEVSQVALENHLQRAHGAYHNARKQLQTCMMISSFQHNYNKLIAVAKHLLEVEESKKNTITNSVHLHTTLTEESLQLDHANAVKEQLKD
jgi:hypothetical protein